ncbi:MAG TPA: lipopolysaccharide heptosyltransferase II [Acidobacteriota bacterium]|jgi:heptosyltransferase-2|nr:lipopolysaccharide heptosyltransferase II [Acidobacteriota bacterium]
MNSILIRATNWIGDCVMSLPALNELRRLHSQMKITVLAKPWVADIYRAGGIADEIIEFDRNAHAGLRGIIQVSRLLRERDFDCALLLQNAFEAALIARLAAIPTRIGYATQHRGFLLTRPVPVHPAVRKMHQSFYYLNLLTESGLSSDRYVDNPGYHPDARLQIAEERKQRAVNFLLQAGVSSGKALIGINPGAFYGPAKRWLPDRYAAVADYLAQRWNGQVLILGSAAEQKIAEEIQSDMKAKPIFLAGKTTLMELMELIACCDLVITNDSGPMHLAAALQRPLIALFGSTDENLTGPMSPIAQVIHKQVECTPCFLRTCPIDLRCFRKIEVEEVCRLADQILSGRQA